MSWLNRLSVTPTASQSHKGGANMNPGITGNYDQALREKAGMHSPPPPPECMGVEGEYDPAGLGKRVAIALDQDPQLPDIGTLHLIQEGNTISLQGKVPDQEQLDRIIKLASQVDGTRSVDASAVTIG